MSGSTTHEVTRLGVADAGEVLTLQRAAFVSEAVVYEELGLPALHQTLEELVAELAETNVVELGVREEGRLLGAVRLRLVARVVHLGRLTVAPDRQGEGIGGALLDAADSVFPDADEILLFTGDRSRGNIALYERHGYVESERVPTLSFTRIHYAKPLVTAAE